ncbi:hypothetical protein SAMN04487950_2892 [Halogranum rubrum]|uniref:Glyoxalase-like domain-containing protein n=1 Tax=Halogranum rubrum TaxID=553466 RepID=A0A1I4FWL0_9EURY|nr:hypothetical protein [Halogranum rubrum]SFL22288.1 hypothetical protein SAMN04487950_2892 [Halogranum rubrum]
MVSTRLFHLHYNTPDVDSLETALADTGIPLARRFGWDDGEFTSLAPDDPIPEAWKLRLETLQTGAVNLTLAPGRQFRFDHLGVVTSAFDAVVSRVRRTDDWSIRDADGRRPFVMTPWGFRVELHPEDGDVPAELGSWDVARLTETRLVVPNDEVQSVRCGLQSVFGGVSGLVVEAGDVDRPTVPSFTVVGDAFSASRTVDVSALTSTDDSAFDADL